MRKGRKQEPRSSVLSSITVKLPSLVPVERAQVYIRVVRRSCHPMVRTRRQQLVGIPDHLTQTSQAAMPSTAPGHMTSPTLEAPDV